MFLVTVSENGHSLHVDDADSEERHGGSTPPLGVSGVEDEVVPRPAGPSYFLYSVFLAWKSAGLGS